MHRLKTAMQPVRTRLVFSHILPLLVAIPLVGIFLVYLLETQVLPADLSDLSEHVIRLRCIVVGTLAVELVLGAVMGSILALNLERSLRRVTDAICGAASGRQRTRLLEQDPKEIRLPLHAFNALMEELRTMEEARRRLLANLVPELGQPIGAMQSAIQALLNGADQESTLRRELLTGMNDQVRRMRPLLDNLTRLYDQALGPLELDSRPTHLSDWLTQAIGSWREESLAKGLHWREAVPDSLPTLNVDPDRLAQALDNLLRNAVTYTPFGGTVSIAAGVQENKGFWIRVSDTGPGIALDDQERVFEPFYRISPDRRFPQGLGLGLSIARDLVIAHGGQLEVKSQPGQGSTFTIWLPPLSRSEKPPTESMRREKRIR